MNELHRSLLSWISLLRYCASNYFLPLGIMAALLSLTVVCASALLDVLTTKFPEGKAALIRQKISKPDKPNLRSYSICYAQFSEFLLLLSTLSFLVHGLLDNESRDILLSLAESRTALELSIITASMLYCGYQVLVVFPMISYLLATGQAKPIINYPNQAEPNEPDASRPNPNQIRPASIEDGLHQHSRHYRD